MPCRQAQLLDAIPCPAETQLKTMVSLFCLVPCATRAAPQAPGNGMLKFVVVSTW